MRMAFRMSPTSLLLGISVLRVVTRFLTGTVGQADTPRSCVFIVGVETAAWFE